MMKRNAFNPYLPLNTYIPDGEPHVFDDRLYVYGSHDQEGGSAFCLLDYEVWSAPVTDLSDWRCEGTIYRPNQDPLYGKPNTALFAPDVVRGPDGRYYLYYAMSGGNFTDPIHVAVCDTPAGQFEYYGEVRNPDGTPFTRMITFDPGVLCENGRVWLYYGWSLAVDRERLKGLESPAFRQQLLQVQMSMFGKTEEEVLCEPDGIMNGAVVELAADMLTVIDGPHQTLPGQFSAAGTEFEGHAFFEASSMRKINGKYYFIYSSEVSHELCYAVGESPIGPFHYGGVLISNGDIGYKGRRPEDRLAMTGNNHGSLVQVCGQWYIFYHRQTHRTSFSRQGCAEKVTIQTDGSIPQVEMTSCGLNDGPLPAEGEYPAVIACNLTNGHMGHAEGMKLADAAMPCITHDGAEHLIADIDDGTLIGYKHFVFCGSTVLTLTLRGCGAGRFLVLIDEEKAGEIPVSPSNAWAEASCRIKAEGVHTLYLRYQGTGTAQLLKLSFQQ